jgi:hypothetical protein
MAVRINELIIRAEIVKQDEKREEQTDQLSEKKIQQILRQEALGENRKKRER